MFALLAALAFLGRLLHLHLAGVDLTVLGLLLTLSAAGSALANPGPPTNGGLGAGRNPDDRPASCGP